MPKAVFTTKVSPAYDDLPEQRYHFPRTYLNAARGALGDWIVYYEPRRSSAHLSSSGGRQSYFATARLVDIRPDPARADHYYGYVRDTWSSTSRYASAKGASTSSGTCRRRTAPRTRGGSGARSGRSAMRNTT